MFTRQQLIAELPCLAAANTAPLEVVAFGHQEFASPCSEQCVEAFRGLKAVFPSGLLFWIKTLQAQGWQGRESYFTSYAESGLCEPVTRAEFAGLVTEYSGSLRQALPPFLVELAEYQRGLRMYAEWNDVAAVAELPDSFVAFYWSTTA